MKKIITLLIISSLSHFSFGQHPTNLAVSNITSDSVDINWDESMCTLTVNLKYRITGSGSTGWVNLTGVSSPYSLSGLTPSTSYEFYVQCAGTTGWSNPSYFTTLCNLNTSVITNNSTCDGSYDGSAFITAFNGTPPYSYLWDNNNNTSSINSIPNNTYIVTTTDSLECSKIDTILIGFDNLISLSQFVSVFTDTSRPEFPNTLQSYQVWAYDTLRLINDGCDINLRPEFIISHQNTPIQINQIMIQWLGPTASFLTIPHSINNNGEAYGFFNTAPSDSTGINSTMFSTNEILLRVKFQGQAPYGTYSAIWNTKEVDALGNIIQTVTQNDTAILTLVDCNSFQSYVSQSDISCWGNSNGILSIDSIVNGSGNYNYNWANDINQTVTISTNNSINNLSQGNYSCNIIDTDWGCTDTINFSISEPVIINGTAAITNVSCYGESNGAATLTLSGGTGNLTIDWNGMNPIALPAGTYMYTITDSINCTFTESVTIAEPIELTSTYTQTNVSCFGANDGGAIVSFFGGTSGSSAGDTNYILGWAGTPLPVYLPFPQTTFNTSLLPPPYNAIPPGIYPYSVTDLNGCVINDTITITQPDEILSELIVTNATCNGSNDGSALVNPGTGHTLLWYDGTTTNLNVGPMAPGIYYVIITNDLTFCEITVYFDITEPIPLTIIENTIDVSCFGDSNGVATLNINGGTSPYTETWNGGSQYNLQEGDYFYIVTDLNNCAISDSVHIYQPTQLNSSITSSDITNCTSDDGIINLSVSGGTGTYSYLWSSGDTSEDLSNLSSGIYSITITDANNCNETNSTSINNYTTNLTTSLNSTNYNGYNIQCFGGNNGTIYSNTSGGNGSLTYLWSNGQDSITATNLTTGSYTLTITDSINCTISADITLSEPNELTSTYTQTNVSCFGANDGGAIVSFFGGTSGSSAGDTNYILGWAGTPLPVYLPFPQTTFNTSLLPPPYNAIPPGIYPYSVTDLNGCVINDTITIIQPDSFSISLSADTICCFGSTTGSISSITTGGTFPYTYIWTNSTGATLSTTNDSVANALSAGTYNCIVTDLNACTIQDSITVYEYENIVTSFTTDNPLCFGDSNACIYINTTGGDGNYTYLWNNGETTANICNLSAGNYSCIVTDGCSCTEIIFVTILEPNEISLNVDSLIDITIYGGNDGFIYISSYGGSGPLNTSWLSDSGFLSNGSDITNLSAGLYYLEITDSNSCTYLDTFEITQPSSLWMNLDLATNTSCFDSCNGALNITANGGDSTYTYNWTGTNSFTSTNNDLTNLCAGEYIITVNDGITSITDTFNIIQPQPITSNLLVDSIICHNSLSQAEINVWGGTQPFIYNWSNGSNSYITTVHSGTHSINVTDQNGCSINQSFSLTNPDSIISITSSTSVNCFGGNNGSISINILNGGISPYNFSDNNGLNYQISNTFPNLLAGNYSFLISDINGCLGSASAEVMQPLVITCNTTAIEASCYGYCDGSVAAYALGGTSPYSYNWTNGASNLCAGFYNVIVTDINGCIGSNSAIVNEPNLILINIWIDGSNIIATSGFTSYQWYDNNNDPINGATDSIFTPSGMGHYYVTVTDTNSCSADSYSIEYTISTIEDYSSNINIFPNPTNKNITVKSEYCIKTIELYNTIGNKLYLVNNNENKITETKLDLSTFDKGVYFIKININNQIINQRIILQ